MLRRLPGNLALPRALVIGSVAAIAAFLVGGLTEYNFGDSEVVMVAWSLMALPFVAAGAVDTPERPPDVQPTAEASVASSIPCGRAR
jgi:hypothetical protein